MPKKRSMKDIGKQDEIHPSSRRFTQLNRVVLRDDKLARMNHLRHKSKNNHVSRAIVFKLALEQAKATTFTEAQIHDVIQQYIARKDVELAEEKAKRRPGRPPSAKQQQLTMSIEQEKKEYETGFYCPDLRDVESCEQIILWSGDFNALPRIKFTRFSKPKEEVMQE
ncbi:translation machinery-associated protein 16 [Saitoella coloradoensis]